MTQSQLAKAAKAAKQKVARHAEGRGHYRPIEEIAAEIARDKAEAEARIAARKATLSNGKGDQA